MRLSRRQPPPPRLVGDHDDRLSRIRTIPRDEDDRPCREDLQAPPGTRLFEFPVPVPRFLTGRRRRRS
jgi:hypothetical protein